MSKKLMIILATVVLGATTLLTSAATASTEREVGTLASMCTTLTTPGGALADVCRASYSEGTGGGYHGWVAGTVFGTSYVQFYHDGAVLHLERPDGAFTFRNMQNVRLRVCNGAGCGDWW